MVSVGDRRHCSSPVDIAKLPARLLHDTLMAYRARLIQHACALRCACGTSHGRPRPHHPCPHPLARKHCISPSAYYVSVCNVKFLPLSVEVEKRKASAAGVVRPRVITRETAFQSILMDCPHLQYNTSTSTTRTVYRQ